MQIKKLITILGILVILASMGFGGYFAYKNGLFLTKAQPGIEPTKIKITNINHDRFTISWITTELTNGSVIYGSGSKLDQLQIDDTDQLSGQQLSRHIHHITLTNLNPETKYQFKIRSGEKNNVFDDSGKPFSVTTAPVLSEQPSADLINGLVTDNDKPAKDAIVYINLPGATALSTQVKKDGTWLINLALARSSNLANYAIYDPQTTMYDLLVQGDNQISTVALTSANDSPVPNVVLGETYDFTSQAAQAPNPLSQPEATDGAELASQLPLDKETSPSAKIPEQNLTTDNEVEILNPLEENESFANPKPQITGVGTKGKILSLSISGASIINTSVKIDNSGNWTYTPTNNLIPGSYSLRISYVDNAGTNQTLNRSFKITNTSGTGGVATGSGSLNTPTPRATIAPRRSMPSTASGTPQSGNELPTFMLLLLGLGLALTGTGWKKTFFKN